MPDKDGGVASSTAPPGPSTDTTNDTPTMTSAKTVGRGPPPEKPEAIRTRSRVIFAFWAVIIFLGIPIWWKTTSIYRASIPVDEMIAWADGKVCRPVFPLEIVVQTPAMQASDAQHLVRTTQHALDDLNEFSAHHLRLKLADSLPQNDNPANFSPSEGDDTGQKADVALVVRLLPRDNLAAPTSELHSYSTELDIFYPPNQVPSPSSPNPPLSTFIAHELQNLFSEEQATITHILSQGNNAGSSLQQTTNAQQPARNTPSPQLIESISRRLTRSLKYAETYHLTISLFTPGYDPSSWDIEAAIQEYLTPLLDALSPISNFSVDTQVQLYAAFSPTAPLPEYDESQGAWTLKKEDLSAFINAAEWPLSPSIGAGPTIEFVLYVPAPSQSPLVVKESGATSWLIPQWGGVAILNPPLTPENPYNPHHLSKESLESSFLTFSHQLLTLLGTPSTPPSLPFRLQTLIRIRAANLLLSASSTMGSLARLTQSLPSIPIPATVATSISTTLSHLAATCTHLKEGRFSAALATARVAEKEAERSFFEKSMVGQVYFPDEHKVAVYLPLLGPIGVPLVISLMKELKRIVADWKAKRNPRS
ncbi:hypothetical protein DTO212C5_4249 [Paecilomyces variotii]|nr:hypothetical protein DTO212C5_4249 [Paecilomyces variotii]